MHGHPKTTNGIRTLRLKVLGIVTTIACGIMVFGTYAKYEAAAQWQHAAEAVSAEAGQRAARIQEWLLRVDRTLNWFRTEDVSTPDRLAVTVRMLHTERFVAPAKTLFLVAPTGRLVAGTLPLPDGSTNLASQRWFRSIQGRPAESGLRLTGCTHDPFGNDRGVVLYRAVLDHDVVAGYAGSFLPQSAIADLTRDNDPTNGPIKLALHSSSGEVFGCGSADPPAAAASHAGLFRAGITRMIHAVLPAVSRSSAVREDRTIEPGGLQLTAAADTLDAMSDDDWTALAYRACYVAITLLLIMALLISMLSRLGQRVRPGLLPVGANPASDGADWMWELDDLGNLVGLAGNAPEHLLPPSGRPLAELAGPIGSSDMRWDKLTATICAKHAFEGLQVPFQMPGRNGLLTIFELSGQPVLASGGFWGTASLVSEESITQTAKPAEAKPQLSVT